MIHSNGYFHDPQTRSVNEFIMTLSIKNSDITLDATRIYHAC